MHHKVLKSSNTHSLLAARSISRPLKQEEDDDEDDDDETGEARFKWGERTRRALFQRNDGNSSANALGASSFSLSAIQIT